MDRIAARVETEVVAGDVPGRPEFVQNAVYTEATANQLTQRLLDGIVLSREADQCELGRECHDEVDVLADQAAEHLFELRDEEVDVQDVRLQHLATAEREQLTREGRSPFAGDW